MKRVKAEGHIKTYVEVFYASWCLLRQAETVPKGSAYQALGSLMMSVFGLEAFLNELGEYQFGLWGKDDRGVGPVGKLGKICDHLQIDHQEREQLKADAKKWVDIRNEIAHGRTQDIQIETEVPDDAEIDPRSLVQADWQKAYDVDAARQAHETVEAIIERLAQAADIAHPQHAFGRVVASTYY